MLNIGIGSFSPKNITSLYNFFDILELRNNLPCKFLVFIKLNQKILLSQ